MSDFTHKQAGRVVNDQLENAHQGRLDLFLQIVVEVDGDIVFKHVVRVFRVLVVFGPFRARDHDVGDAVADLGRVVYLNAYPRPPAFLFFRATPRALASLCTGYL